MNVAAFLLLFFIAFFVLLFIFSTILKKILWVFSPIFFGINDVIWFLYNPLRGKNKEKATANIFFNVFFYTLAIPVYWIFIHLLLTPLRIVNALYFDVLLYISVMLGDLVAELFDPKVGGMRHKKGTSYLVAYVTKFPWRLVKFFTRGFLTFVDSLFMFSMAVVLPTLTMYHGTDFQAAISNIGQKGRWKVGGGQHAGRGVYLALEKRVADHYARGKQYQGVVVVRATLSFVRNIPSLGKDSRDKVGWQGGEMSQEISRLWSTTEHWRDGSENWWEYCLIHRGSVGEYIKTWRIRPVAFLNEKASLERLWEGQAHYSINTFKSFVIGVVCTVLMVPFVSASLGLLVQIFG